MGTVYLLHYDAPIGDPGNPHGYAQHYIGWTDDLETRLDEHAHGAARARLTTAFYQAGISFVLARTWEGDRKLERRLKNRKNAPRLCPICRGNHEKTI